ncbi:MAG TPA: MFS transporter [Pseudonocardiaceae bacterium]|nr:MFS transporter [Pseudonocardiaceae bacterium]
MRDKWWPLLAICLGTFMLLVDVTIVSVALPSMAVELHASFSSLQWVIDAYAVALAALLLVAGSIADRFGRRKLYAIGLALFAVSSLCCGLAPNVGLLITARVAQGIGGAAMFSTNTALLSVTYTGRDRGVAFGVWGAVSGAAAAIAPIFGGLLTQTFGWRSIFLINLPIAAIALLLVWRVLTESRGAKVRIDWPGAILITAFAGLLTFGLIHGGDTGWTSMSTLAVLAASILSLIAFVLVERNSATPLLDLALLRRRSFATLMLAAMVLTGSAFSSAVYLSLWLQSVLGEDAMLAGLVLAPLAIVSFVVSITVGRFMHRGGYRWPLGIGLVLIGIGSVLRMFITADSGASALFAGLIVTGIGVGLASPVLVSAALGSVPAAKAGMAAGAVNTFRQLGYALGIAVLGSVLTGRITGVLTGNPLTPNPVATATAVSEGKTPQLVGTAQAGLRGDLDHLLHAAFANGLDYIQLISGIIGVLGGLLVLTVVNKEPAVHAVPERTDENPVPAAR